MVLSSSLSRCLLAVGLPALAFLAGCGKVGEPESAVKTEPEMMDLDAAVSAVKAWMPAEGYMTNRFIPGEEAMASPPAFDRPVTLRVGAPWILNDEVAPWFLASDLGFFEEAGISVDLVAGGPGKNHLTTLMAGNVDLTVINESSHVPKLLASPTGKPLLMIGTLLRRSPFIYLGIDDTVPTDQPSHRQPAPADLAGARIGVEITSEHITDFLIRYYRLDPEPVKVRGASMEMLRAGRVDFMAAWIQNQPRVLEREGILNWYALPKAAFGWEEYADVSVVLKSFAEENPDVLRRYLWGLRKGIRFMLDHPERAAAITAPYIPDTGLTASDIRRRFELQRDLVLGEDGDLLRMDPETLDVAAAHMVMTGILDPE
ncbi:MAG: ABC transporter substrate-binding protein [Opitutales bacterium]